MKQKALNKKIALLFFILMFNLISSQSLFATNRIINLVVAYKNVNFAGKCVRAIAVNNQIPGPTLHFKEGDHVTINVHNHLDTGTTLHWHGLIVPWRMDGVANVSQKPIPPGGVFHYKFTLHQAGTYWYHSHFVLQEQEGEYGAIIIAPKKQRLKYNKDFVILLSDWSNTKAHQIFSNLKKDGDFYSPKFPLQPSLLHFIKDYNHDTPVKRKHLLKAYWSMQMTRMGPYDIADIAYDAFLLNGHPAARPWTGKVKVGDTVRLRFIGAGASTIFQVKIPGTKMQLVQVDGKDVQPYFVKSLRIAPGETDDVLVKITQSSPYIIYAEASSQAGETYGALITKPRQFVHYKKVKPFPEPAPTIMKMTVYKPGHEPTQSTPTQYSQLKSVVKTNDPNKSVHIIKMTLSGYMGRYIWFLNGKPEYKAKPIMIKHGQRYRFIFINNTVMRHPMHIHGHWFILRNGHGAYDPLMHTIDVPAGATVVADILAKESGQWYFHCHNLYHMKAGMANIVRYETPPGQKQPNFLPGGNAINWYFSNRLDISGDFIHHVYQVTLNTLMGTDDNKLQIYMNEAEIDDGTLENADVDVFYYRPINQFWAIKGGVNYFNKPAETPYLQPGIGIEGLMPFFIATNVRAYYHDGSAKFDLELNRATQITNNFFIGLGVRGILATKTLTKDEIGNGLNYTELSVRPFYRLTPNLSVYLEYEHTQYYGSLKRIRRDDGEPGSDDLFSLGVALLF